MDFLVQNWTLVLLALASGGMLLWPKLQGGTSAGLSAAAVVQKINREKAVVIDVCGADEFAAGHVAGARSIPLDELSERLPAAVKNKARPLVMVCASGVRSRKAVAIARKLGYDAEALSGGLKSWREAHLPVERG